MDTALDAFGRWLLIPYPSIGPFRRKALINVTRDRVESVLWGSIRDDVHGIYDLHGGRPRVRFDDPYDWEEWTHEMAMTRMVGS